MGNWQLAVGSWQLAVGSWQLAVEESWLVWGFVAYCRLLTADFFWVGGGVRGRLGSGGFLGFGIGGRILCSRCGLWRVGRWRRARWIPGP